MKKIAVIAATLMLATAAWAQTAPRQQPEPPGPVPKTAASCPPAENPAATRTPPRNPLSNTCALVT